MLPLPLLAQDASPYPEWSRYDALIREIKSVSDFAERAKLMHCHFSKIEYSKGGEVRHLTFEDRQFGPHFDTLAALLAQRDLSPHIICESAGTQDLDALAMKNMYKEECKRYGNQN